MEKSTTGRTFRPGAITLLVFLAACEGADPPAPDPARTTVESMPSAIMSKPPQPDQRPLALTLHGQTRVDEYHWLRDDSRSDPEVLAHLAAENRWLDRVMEHTKPLQARLYEEMTGRLDPDESSVPWEKDGWHYYSRYEEGLDYPIHARRRGSMEAVEEILLDGNARAAGHEFYALGNLEVSDDHRWVAIAEDTLGRRIHEIRILDTTSGEYLPEVIGNAAASLAWSADGRYLFYLEKHPQTLRAWRVMRHERGTDPSADALVYEERDDTFYSYLHRSRSGAYVFLVHSQTDSSEVQWLDAARPLDPFRPFLPREENHEYDVDHAGDSFWIRSNWRAENFRVLRARLEDSADKERWEEVVPHREDALVEELQAFDDWLLLGERRDGLRRVRVLAHDGGADRYLEAPEEVFVMWPATNVRTDTNRVRYGYASPTTPGQTWEIDLATGVTELLKATRVPGDFDSGAYGTRRLWVTARDGARVPVSLAFRRDTALDGSAPALVYGYGSYGSSSDPWFRSSVISLLDRGFVFAIAHVRGGEEMGRRWYEQGRLMHKWNSFNDFIDVTRALQDQGLVDRARTFAMGGSAGGLLVGAVINEAPELYLGVVAAVPFVDVVTTMLDESIPLTTGEFDEWGDPKERGAYEYMLSYSPYDQVREQAYPHLLVTTGLHDSQVQYWEPAKWVARLRDRRRNDNRLLLHVNMEAGHGGASGRYRQYEETALEYAFLLDLAGAGK